MSSTRRAVDGALHQERFCSAPEFEGDTINGLAAAKRIAIVKEQSIREILWFIQWRSLAVGGLRELCEEVVREFPARLTTRTLQKLRQDGRSNLKQRDVEELRKEFRLGGLEMLCTASDFLPGRPKEEFIPLEQYEISFYEQELRYAIEDLPSFLARCCLDPTCNIVKGVWYFQDLLGALVRLRDQFIAAARSRLAETAVSKQINDTLDFWYARRRMVLIEGVAGIGRTETAKAWRDAHAGMVRYIEVPSSSDDRSFYASIARAWGVANGASYKAQQIKVRIEEMLLTSGLALAMDESQYLWGQFIRPRRTPDRILWIKTIFDAGTPIALIAHTDFSKWQQHYIDRTLWTDEQFERRLNRRLLLPGEHSKDDMLKIAKAHLPNGDSRSWKLLAAYALATEKKQASGIVEALESAMYRAKQAGREEVSFKDIEVALIHDHGFAAATTATHSEFAKPQKQPCKSAAVDIRARRKAANFRVLAPAYGGRERVPIPL